MADRHQTYYLNADFDLTLRSHPPRTERAGLDRQVRELSVQALVGAGDGDAALVRTEVHADFLDHLGESGLPVPRVLVHPALDPSFCLRPFGWSSEAMELNRRHRLPVEHPSLETIRRVNSRSFALALEAEICRAETSSGAVLESRAELDDFLANTAPHGEWVVKTEHGNAGLGNRRLRPPELTAADLAFVDRSFTENDRVIIEPWLPREHDWCVVFDVPFDPATLRVHETICTADGALIGALFEPGGPTTLRWPEEITRIAGHLGSRLEAEGYLGPACFDAFSWRDGVRVRLRALADLNCRHAMSDGAYRLWRQLAPDRPLYYRFFNRRKLTLPAELPAALAALAGLRYRSRSGQGILLASPVDFAKLAVVIIAETRPQIHALEHDFRARFES